MATNGPVVCTADAGIFSLRFNRPDRLNVLNQYMADAFAAGVDRAVRDPSVRVIVISAEGRSFMAGADLGPFLASKDRPATARALIDPVHGALVRLAEVPAITIGSLQGAVAGGGMSLALNLDLLVAADDTTFNLAYARIGASPDCGGTWALPRLVGYRRALQMALLSQTVDAEEALRLGLVNQVVARAELDDVTMALARKLAAGAPAAQARIKALMRQSMAMSYRDQLDAEAESFCECALTDDFGEALEAFFGKRKATFTGR